MEIVPNKNVSHGIRLRRYFFAGLAVLFPIFITYYVVVLVFHIGDDLVGKHFNHFLMANYGFSIPGLGLLFTIVIILFMGMVSVHIVGKKLIPFFEHLLFRLPFIKNIYPPAKQLSAFLFKHDQQEKLGKVVMVEFPYPGIYSMGFITNEELAVHSQKVGEDLVSVLVSTPPSPVTGFLLLVPKSKVRILDISMEEAIAFIVSAGVVAPLAKKEISS
jgi:uncharacterized membrane protein